MKISIIIPVYNEQGAIVDVINSVKSAIAGADHEIIVVNDASTDKTREFLDTINDVNVKIVHRSVNQGKGAAIREGIKHINGDITIIQDADREYTPEDYPALLRPIIDGKADVVFGSRFLGGGTHRVMFFWHSIGNRFLTLLSNIFTDLNLTDMEVGYKVFRTDTLKRIELKQNRFGFEPEITAKIAKTGSRVYEVPISYYGRTYAEGKKITWKDGIHAIWCIVRYGIGR